MPESECEINVDLCTEEEKWHNAVALKAYRKWQHEGCPEGTGPDGKTWAERFWLRAEAELKENGFG